MYTAATCYWENKKDGLSAVSFTNETIACFITIYCVAIQYNKFYGQAMC